MLDDVAQLLGAEGPFVSELNQFSVRSQQQTMATAVSAAIQKKQDLIVEAGTGTGKTFAYLVPAILSGRKVVISTGTKNLQDQLFHRDIPLVRRALPVSTSCALLKGRSNYLCLHRLEQQLVNRDKLEPSMIPILHGIKDWSRQTVSGDVAEYTRLPEGDRFWPSVTSTTDNCLGSDCEFYQKCHVMASRREAQAADVVVINHHLLLSDMALLEEGFGELLPAADVYIIDEAHQLAETASQFFGVGMSTQQFVELAHDTLQAYIHDINESHELEPLCDSLIKSARDLRLCFGKQLRRAAWREIKHDKVIQKYIQNLRVSLEQFGAFIAPLAERAETLASCHDRYIVLKAKLAQLTQEVVPGYIHWFEVHYRSLTIHMTPLQIAPAFQEKKTEKSGTWVFTSATLMVDGQFDYFAQSLGLTDYRDLALESPFDYAQQALLYTPVPFPEPNSQQYLDAVVECAKQILAVSQGRAFLLFTSFRALHYVYEAISELPYSFLVQGDAPRDELLAQFRQSDKAVLLGTNSFWEGVDVRGEALTCVLIDKLPFAAPNDPVLQARLDALREQGLNPFMKYQLPMAAIMLKQGAGRLIRDKQDYGVLVLCDPRLRTKSYGKTFFKSLPAMPRSQKMQDVVQFFARKQQALEEVM